MSNLNESNNRAAAGYPSHRDTTKTEQTPSSRHQYQMGSNIFELEKDSMDSVVIPSEYPNKEEIAFSNFEHTNMKDNFSLGGKKAAGYASFQVPGNMKPGGSSRHHYNMSSDILGEGMGNSRSFTTFPSMEQMPKNPVALNRSSDVENHEDQPEQISAWEDVGKDLEEQAYKPGIRRFEGKNDSQKLW